MNVASQVLLVVCGMMLQEGAPAHPNTRQHAPDCIAVGQQYGKSLDKHTTLGRVVWSDHLKSCIAETANIAYGTEMYSVVAIPSKKTIAYDGGLIAVDHRSSKEKAAQHQRLFEEAMSGK